MSMQDELFSRAANMRGRPAVVVALFFITGIVTANLFPPPTNVFPLIYGATILSIVASLFAFSKHYYGVFILAAFMVLGYAKYSVESSNLQNRSADDIVEPARNVLAWGTIVDRPRIGEDRSRFILRTDSLYDGRVKFHTTHDLLVIVSPDARYDSGLLNVEYGEYVLVHGFINLPAGRRNPYDPDFNRYLELHNISAMVFVRGYYNIETKGPGDASRFIRGFIVPIRDYISGVIDRNLSGESAHFLRGLLLGDRSRIGDDVRETFITAGVIHVLAVSGLHVGIMLMIFFAVFGFLRIPRIPKLLMTIAGLIIFMFVTGAAPSVVRATIMASIILIGFILQRKSDIYNSIAVAALILLFHDSRELFKPSFQLSFAAVLSIVYLYPRFWGGIRWRFPHLEERWLIRYFIQLFLVSCAAQIGTLPFTAYYFERISLIAFIANLLVIPGVFFVLSFGFASVLFGGVSSIVERIYGLVTEFLLTGILSFVDLISQLSFASIEVYHFGVLGGLLFYAIISVVVHITHPRRFRSSCVGLLVVLNIYVINYNVTFDPESRQPLLTITMLDVGQGDALFIEFPDGRNMLYDAGPRTLTSDAGERTVIPFLKRHGVRYIDAVVISHGHTDHYGGLKAVLREIDVGTIYDTGQPVSGVWYKNLYEKIERKNVAVELVRAGDIINTFDNVRLYVVHPAPAFIQQPGDDRSWNLNNASIVLLLVFGDVRILLTGDAEMEAENYMLHFYGDFLEADILKAGHHGSNTSSTERFVEIVSPGKALISVGRMNRFNHPGDKVVKRFNDNNVVTYRTDIHGAVTVRSCGNEFWVQTMR